jgi:O-antigen/teichoic acid export membrane protein
VNKKRIAITLFMALLSEIANKLAPLVTLHIVATRLGPDAFGSAQYALWLLDWGIFVTIFGFSQTAPIQLREAYDEHARARVTGGVLGAKLVLAILSSMALFLATSTRYSLGDYREPVLAAIFVMITTSLDCVWALLARQKMAVISGVSIVARLFSVVAVYALVAESSHAVRFVVISCAANSLISVASFLVTARDIGISLPDWKIVIRSLRLAAPYAVLLLLLMALDRFDLYLVERDFTLSETGIYSAAAKLVGSMVPIITSVTSVFYSEMIAHEKSEDIFRHLRASVFWVLSITAPIVALIWMFDAEFLTLIFGPAFAPGAATLNILTGGVLGSAMILIFGFQLLALRREWLPVCLSLALGCVAGISASFLFMATHGTAGIAMGVVTGKIIAALVITAVALRRWNLNARTLLVTSFRSILPAAGMALIITTARGMGWQTRELASGLLSASMIYILLFSLMNLREVQIIVSKIQSYFNRNLN